MVDIGGRNPNLGVGTTRPIAQLSELESRLLNSGVVKTPAAARAMAKAILKNLQSAGVAKGKTNLKDALLQFQKQNGLPQTGRLDSQTMSKLQELGLMPQTPGQGQATGANNNDVKLPKFGGELGLGTPGSAQTSDNFSTQSPANRATIGDAPRSPLPPPAAPPSPQAALANAAPIERTHTVEQRQAVERSLLTKETKAEDLNKLLQNLSSLGFNASGKGRAKLTNALKAFQHAQSLPTSGKADAQTIQALVNEGILPQSTVIPSDASKADPSKVGGDNAPVSGLQNAQGEGDPDTAVTTHQGVSDASHGSAQEDIDYGSKNDKNNSAAGDEDETDTSRGHAQHKEGEHDEGYYEIPTLAIQLIDGLKKIKRNDDEKGALTYSWDVTFHKPGVYGAKQPAQALWHIVVDKASPFDSVWSEAREKLNTRIKRIEPDTPELTAADFRSALQRARFRED